MKFIIAVVAVIAISARLAESTNQQQPTPSPITIIQAPPRIEFVKTVPVRHRPHVVEEIVHHRPTVHHHETIVEEVVHRPVHNRLQTVAVETVHRPRPAVQVAQVIQTAPATSSWSLPSLPSMPSLPSLPDIGAQLGASITQHWENKRPPAKQIIIEQPIIKVVRDHQEPKVVKVIQPIIHKERPPTSTTRKPCCNQ